MEMGRSGLTCLEMPGNCCKQLEMARNDQKTDGRKLLEMAGNCKELLEIAGNGQELLEMAKNYWKGLGMAVNCFKWPEMAIAGNCWKSWKGL